MYCYGTPSKRMEETVSRIHLRQAARQVVTLTLGAAVLGVAPAGSVTLAGASLPTPGPTVGEYQFLAASTTPPTEANCFSVGRRCFTTTSIQIGRASCRE